MKDFKQLKVWEKMNGLALSFYTINKNFPKADFEHLGVDVTEIKQMLSGLIKTLSAKS